MLPPSTSHTCCIVKVKLILLIALTMCMVQGLRITTSSSSTATATATASMKSSGSVVAAGSKTSTLQGSAASASSYHRYIRSFSHSSRLHQSSAENSAESDSIVAVEEEDDHTNGLPTVFSTAANVDYVPLANMLMTRDFLAADQFTRDIIITLSGAEAQGRNFVYWTEVKKIPELDMKTIEKLWLTYSNGKFGYSVQSRLYNIENGDFDNFIRRIGWTKIDPISKNERKLKWFGENEFMYDLETAPVGHLPLTSALRGTQLLKMLMTYPLWSKYDWKNYQAIPWD